MHAINFKVLERQFYRISTMMTMVAAAAVAVAVVMIMVMMIG
jgi:hypothetical protein